MGRTCGFCGADLPKPKGRGGHRRYCSSRCRTAAYRRRRDYGAPLPDGLNAGDPITRLSEALLAARGLVTLLNRLEPDLAPPLAARSGTLAESIGRAVDDSFGGIA